MRNSDGKAPAVNNVQSLAKLKKGKFLGKGGFGCVYESEYKGVPIALKIIEVHSCDKIDRILDEVKIGQQLSHPNLLTTMASEVRLNDTMAQEVWIVLELCKAGNIRGLIDNDSFRLSTGLPDMVMVVQNALSICAGMDYLHQNNVIHGDLSANNVLMTAEGHPKISDFGMSRTNSGKTVETEAYGLVTHMPPELLSEGRLSFKTDTYGFGVLLWELVTGRHAWEGLRQAQVITDKLTNPESLALTERESDVINRMFADLIQQCVNKDYKLRPDWKTIHQVLLDVLKEVSNV